MYKFNSAASSDESSIAKPKDDNLCSGQGTVQISPDTEQMPGNIGFFFFFFFPLQPRGFTLKHPGVSGPNDKHQEYTQFNGAHSHTECHGNNCKARQLVASGQRTFGPNPPFCDRGYRILYKARVHQCECIKKGRKWDFSQEYQILLLPVATGRCISAKGLQAKPGAPTTTCHGLIPASAGLILNQPPPLLLPFNH